MNEIEVRAFLLGFVGLALSFYSLTNGQAEWTLGVNGPFASSNQVKINSYIIPNGQKIIVGLGVLPALLSGVLSGCLIAGVFTAKEVLLLPPLIYTISELVKDISTSIVTSLIIYARFGNPAALVYILFNSLMLVFNAYLWYGALQLYEHHTLKENLDEYERRMKKPEESLERYHQQWDSDESLGTLNFALEESMEESRKNILQEFEEFKRIDRAKEKYTIHNTKNTFIEPFRVTELDHIIDK